MKSCLLRSLVCVLMLGVVVSGGGVRAAEKAPEKASKKNTTLYSTIAAGPYDNRVVNAVAALIETGRDNRGIAGMVTAKDSAAALHRLQEKQVDVAIVPSDLAWAAYKSYAPFVGQAPFQNMRVLGSLDDDNLVLMTRQLRGARLVSQMQQYRVGLVGPAYDIFDYILETNRMSSSDLAYIRSFTPGQAIDALCSGEADIIVMYAGNNDVTIRDLYNRCPAMVLPLEDETMQTLVTRFPYLGRGGFQTKWFLPSGYVINTLTRSLLVLGLKDLDAEKVDYWAKKLEQASNRNSNGDGESPWLLNPRSARSRAMMAGLPVHEKLAPPLPPPLAPVSAVVEQPEKTDAPAAQPEAINEQKQ